MDLRRWRAVLVSVASFGGYIPRLKRPNSSARFAGCSPFQLSLSPFQLNLSPFQFNLRRSVSSQRDMSETMTLSPGSSPFTTSTVVAEVRP